MFSMVEPPKLSSGSEGLATDQSRQPAGCVLTNKSPLRIHPPTQSCLPFFSFSSYPPLFFPSNIPFPHLAFGHMNDSYCHSRCQSTVVLIPHIAALTCQMAQLCSICRELELLGTDKYLSFEHEDEWPALGGLARSALAGCDFCRMLRESFLPIYNNISALDGSDPLRLRRVIITIAPIHCQQQQVTPSILRRIRLHVRVRDKETFPSVTLRTCNFLLCSDVWKSRFD